jgi:hypothetical protein
MYCKTLCKTLCFSTQSAKRATPRQCERVTVAASNRRKSVRSINSKAAGDMGNRRLCLVDGQCIAGASSKRTVRAYRTGGEKWLALHLASLKGSGSDERRIAPSQSASHPAAKWRSYWIYCASPSSILIAPSDPARRMRSRRRHVLGIRLA